MDIPRHDLERVVTKLELLAVCSFVFVGRAVYTVSYQFTDVLQPAEDIKTYTSTYEVNRQSARMSNVERNLGALWRTIITWEGSHTRR